MGCLSACAAVSAALAFACALAALALPGLIRWRLDAAVREQIVWSVDSPPFVYSHFARDTHPGDPTVYFRAWFLNITNLEDVRAGGKPVLAELGPYTFIKHRVKRRVWFSREGRVQFRTYVYHLHQPHLSNGSLDDPVTTLNIPLVGAMEAITSLSPSAAASWLHILAGLVESWGDPRVKGLFTTRTVGEMLWGYRDPLLARLAPFVTGVDPTFQLVHNMSSPAEAELDDGQLTVMDTGLRNLSRVWQTEVWANVSEVTSWNPPHVERVHGSDGFQFRPGLELNGSVDIWVGDFFRAVTLRATEEARVGHVPALRVRIDPPQLEPDERYFQYVRGLINITAPKAAGPSGTAGKPGPPLFLSPAHYCGVDEAVAQGVEGLACDSERHELFMDVEPTTGISLRAAARMMLSSWFGRKYSTLDRHVQDTYLPIFWVQESAEATPELLQNFNPLLMARTAMTSVRAWGLPASIALAVLAAALAGAAGWQHAQSQAGIGAAGGQEARSRPAADVERGGLPAAGGGAGALAEAQQPLLAHPASDGVHAPGGG